MSDESRIEEESPDFSNSTKLSKNPIWRRQIAFFGSLSIYRTKFVPAISTTVSEGSCSIRRNGTKMGAERKYAGIESIDVTISDRRSAQANYIERLKKLEMKF